MSKTDIKDTQVEDTPKKYYNFFLFKVSENIFFSYLYLFTSVGLTVVNRIVFQKYNFKFNYTLMFLQQLVCSIFFTLIAPKFKNFDKVVGEISFKDFWSRRLQYIFFCGLFMMNLMSSFYGNQLVKNTAMYLILRKFLTVMNYLYDLFINKKKLPNYFTQSVIMITLGSILTGYDDLSSDMIGYVVVFVNNFFSLIYGQFSESFSKKNGVPNVKLIIYNSYMITPFMFFLIFATGEYVKVLEFFNNQSAKGIISEVGFLLLLFVSCSMTIVLNLSYFISNEKNSSLFTQLLSNCKVILLHLLI